MNGITVIPTALEHIPALAELEKLCFSAPHSAAALGCDLTNPSCVMLSALCEGRLAGYASFHYVLDEGYTDNVAVMPQFRRRGVAEALMAAFDENAERLRLSFITLEVRVSNAPAIALYEKCGFSRAAVRRDFYSLPREDAYIYTKRYDK